MTSASAFGFVRVAVISPELQVADVTGNTRAILEALSAAADQTVQLAVLPELAIVGYTSADLLYQPLLLEAAWRALAEIAGESATLDLSVAVGLPVVVEGRLYNCAAFVSGGRVLGIVPKSYLPTTNEYYERRWFSSGRDARAQIVRAGGTTVPFGTDLLFPAANVPECVVGLEICEDLWAVHPPSGDLALAGATVLMNPSASVELLGKSRYRRDLVQQQSARCMAAYLYSGAGPGESTTDVVFSGHSLIAENGVILAEAGGYHFDGRSATTDVDLQKLIGERVRNSAFSCASAQRAYRQVEFTLPRMSGGDGIRRKVLYPVSPRPFVPADDTRRAAHCREVFEIQSTGLARRLRHTRARTAVVGVSGGLDSTLAMLVTARAFDTVGLPRSSVLGVTMPGFGTSDRTRCNAQELVTALGATLKVIPIERAVRQHFADIGHDEATHDIVYENAQARERTQILMDLANQQNGLVVGTGDLSELALGWSTYNGDHMSAYNVNAGVPKTLVRYLVAWVAEHEYSGRTADVLRDICNTPVSPELLPVSEGQLTEASVGPYDLHDFFLYYVVRHQFPPRKILFLAEQAFEGEVAASEIVRWMKVFYQRFFSQQFKRSALPDGPKVGSVALSPRGDWRMPSDAVAALWIDEIESLAQ
jgi:NAD+ synthase (glutamine-hydrolysing)